MAILNSLFVSPLVNMVSIFCFFKFERLNDSHGNTGSHICLTFRVLFDQRCENLQKQTLDWSDFSSLIHNTCTCL